MLQQDFGCRLRGLGARIYFFCDCVLLGLEIAKEKKYTRLFHNGSRKDHFPKKTIKYDTPEPSLWCQAVT